MLDAMFVSVVTGSAEMIVYTLGTAPQDTSHTLLTTPGAVHVEVLDTYVCAGV